LQYRGRRKPHGYQDRAKEGRKHARFSTAIDPRQQPPADWQTPSAGILTAVEGLTRDLSVDRNVIDRGAAHAPMRINPYDLALVWRHGGPLEWLLAGLHDSPHGETIRIHSRVPATLPRRITPALAALLQHLAPLCLNTHIQSPRLVEVSIPVGCQTVLLRGVNGAPEAMQALMRRLVVIQVRPTISGPVRCGLAILRTLHGHLSGLGVPQ
jgi:hypothetical protein